MTSHNSMHDDISEAVVSACRRGGLGNDTCDIWVRTRVAVRNRPDIRDPDSFTRAVASREVRRGRKKQAARGRQADWSAVLECVNDRRSPAPDDYDVCDEVGRREEVARVAAVVAGLSADEQALLWTLIPDPRNGQVLKKYASQWDCSPRTIRRRAVELGGHVRNLLGGMPGGR